MKLLPRKTTFFDLFDQHAANLVEICEALRDMLQHFDRLEERKAHVKALEHRGDEITHELARQMNATFVTPLDKEDIAQLYSGLDDVVDYVDAAADRFLLYKISSVTPEARELTDLMVETGRVLQGGVNCIRSTRKGDQIMIACREIHRLENESDTIYRRALGTLFNEPGIDPIEVIKWKEIYERLEMAVDKMEDVSNVLESIQLKYG